MPKSLYIIALYGLIALSIVPPACTPSQYASQADKSAYNAVKDANQLAGLGTLGFSIKYDPLLPTVATTTAPASAPATCPASAPTGARVLKLTKRTVVLPATQPAVLTLDDALEVAFRNSRQFQDQKEDLYKKALLVSTLRRGWDYPALGGEVTGLASHDKINDGPEVNTGAASATPTLVQKLRQGGLLTLSYGLALATDFSNWSPDTITSALGATFTQPLLRGAWCDFAYEPVYRAERDLLFSAYSYERFTQTFATEIVQAYYQVLRQRDQIENDQANIRRLKETFNLTRVLVEGGQVSRIEQDQAEQDLLDAQIRIQESQRVYQNLLDEFKITLGLPISVRLEPDYPKELELLNKAGPQPVPVAEDRAIEIAFTTRPDVLTAAAKVRDADRNVEMAADNFLPQLDLQLGIVAPGTPPRDFQKTRFDRNRRTASLTLDYPIDQTANRDLYRVTLIEKDKSRRDLSEFLDRVRIEVRESYRSLLQSRMSYDLQVRSVEIAKRRRKLAALQQREGQASARDVLDAEEALRVAQNGLTNALVEYATTRLSFLGRLGMLSVDEKGQIHERQQPDEFNAIQRRYPYVRQP